MKEMLVWILVGMIFVSAGSLAHEAKKEIEEHDKINYTLEEFYLPMIVVSSIIGMIIYNLKKPTGERDERS